MARPFTDKHLIIATHNTGKLEELRDFFTPLGITLSSAADHNIPEPEETGTTFTDNAALKAQHSTKLTGLPALADDSGFCVHAINDEPGIYSARWAITEAGKKDFAAAAKKIWDKLQNQTNHSAHFVCALALAWPDGHVETVEGYAHGSIIQNGRGTKGFGYDPYFIPDGYQQTFGEMNPETKQTISHRADAFEKLLKLCFS